MKMRYVIPLVLAAVSAAQTPQQQQTMAGVVRLNRAPVSNEVLRVKLPRPEEKRLSNGLQLLVVENHRLPAITLRITVPSGDLRDTEIHGISDATAALMRLGTKTRSAKDIAESLADLGATLSIGSSEGNASIMLSANTENFDAALALMGDVLLNPSFPQEELDKWKARQRAQLEQLKSNPGFLANDLMMKVLYPDDARHYTHPTPESLGKISRESLVEHYKKYYVPAGQWAGIAGDISSKDAVAKLEKVLSGWKGGPIAPVKVAFPEPLAEKKVYLIPRPNSVQTLLLITNRAIDRKSPDYVGCQVMNRVLGSGPTSRLFRIIREEKGYTYGVGSGFSASQYVNYFTASTSVRTEVTEPALAELIHQFTEIRDRPVPADELADAKSAIVASFVLGLENPAAVLSRWLDQRELGLPEDYWDTYPAKVSGVSAADVQRVAKKYVPLDNTRIIAVGDKAKIAELLKKFGPVEEVSPDSM